MREWAKRNGREDLRSVFFRERTFKIRERFNRSSMTSSNGDVSPSSVPSEWVRLNVGGTVFTTTKSTLQKDRESFLVSVGKLAAKIKIYSDFQIKWSANISSVCDFVTHEIIVNSTTNSWQPPLGVDGVAFQNFQCLLPISFSAAPVSGPWLGLGIPVRLNRRVPHRPRPVLLRTRPQLPQVTYDITLLKCWYIISFASNTVEDFFWLIFHL